MTECRRSVEGRYLGLVRNASDILDEAYDYGPGAFWRLERGSFGMLVPFDWSRECVCLLDIFYCPHRRPGDQICWTWNGSDHKATLTPSIHSVGQWHGWLQDGNLVSV